MVCEQIEARGLTDPVLLAAFRRVPREEFVLPEDCDRAQGDHPLPIGFGQTISQPYIVALMTDALHPCPGERILEIGTGSGYQSAILAALGAKVYSLEIIPELAARARRTLDRLGLPGVEIRNSDGFRGWPEQAPFDGILAACAPAEIPPPLVAQLRLGGRLVMPVGGAFEQSLVVLDRTPQGLQQRRILAVRFVPMTGEAERCR